MLRNRFSLALASLVALAGAPALSSTVFTYEPGGYALIAPDENLGSGGVGPGLTGVPGSEDFVEQGDNVPFGILPVEDFRTLLEDGVVRFETPIVADVFQFFVSQGPDQVFDVVKNLTVTLRDPQGDAIFPPITRENAFAPLSLPFPLPEPPAAEDPVKTAARADCLANRRYSFDFCNAYAAAVAGESPGNAEAVIACFQNPGFGFGGAGPACQAQFVGGGTSDSANDPQGPDQTDQCVGGNACSTFATIVRPGMEIAEISAFVTLFGSEIPLGDFFLDGAGFSLRKLTPEGDAFFRSVLGEAPQATVIPLPSAGLLLATGMMLLAGARRLRGR